AQRLLAHHVLAGAGGVNRDLGVQTIGSGDRDHLDVGIAQQLAVVGVRARDAVPPGEARGVSPRGRGHGDDLRFVRDRAPGPLDAFTIRCRARILKHAVVAHERHDGIDVMAIEGVVEPLHDVDDAAGLGHCSRRTKYPATRHPRFPSKVWITFSTTWRPPETSVLYCSST